MPFSPPDVVASTSAAKSVEREVAGKDALQKDDVAAA
jgi:hypothetical protein